MAGSAVKYLRGRTTVIGFRGCEGSGSALQSTGRIGITA